MFAVILTEFSSKGITSAFVMVSEEDLRLLGITEGIMIDWYNKIIYGVSDPPCGG